MSWNKSLNVYSRVKSWAKDSQISQIVNWLIFGLFKDTANKRPVNVMAMNVHFFNSTEEAKFLHICPQISTSGRNHLFQWEEEKNEESERARKKKNKTK